MASFKKVPLIRDEKKSELSRFALVGFAVFVLLNGVNVYGEAKGFYRQARGFALQGAEELFQGATALKNQNFILAQSQFEQAHASLKNLEEASRTLTAQTHDFLGQGLAASTVEQLIDMGLEASELGQNFALSLEAWKKEPQKVPLDFLRSSQKSLTQLGRETESLKKKVKAVRLLPLPQPLKSKIKKMDQELSQFSDLLDQGRITAKAALQLLGSESPHHYLVLFQNRNERRATGGFIGSYLLVTMNDGKITKLEPKDVYESDGQLAKSLPPPPGIDQITDTWGLRDANYSPDFPTSAKQIMWFLEQSRGPSVDTVVALDQTVAEKLMELTGPVEIPGFPFTLKAKNLDNILSFYTEAKLSKGKTPKGLLFDLIPVMQKKLTELKNFEAIQSMVQALIADGHIQLYSEDPAVQSFAETWKMDGRLLAPAPKTDYLAVISTSIGGNKSDRFIRMNLDHQTQIGTDGSIVDTLVIQKQHTWQKTDWNRFKRYFNYYGPGSLSERSLRFIVGEGPNVDYLRVYVPRGSRLLHQEGVEKTVAVEKELSHTVFAFILTTNSGETTQVTLEYELPFQLLQSKMDDYRLITEKQAGASGVNLNKSLFLAEGLTLVREYLEDPLFLVSIKK